MDDVYDDMYIGRILDGRYEILEKIGSGGMAVVYKARCHRLNRFVAIKILKSDLAQNPDLRRRFHAESQAIAMLSHPNIVSVYDVNHTDNLDYIVMELIEGITLKQYINRKGILNWKEALHFTTQIVKALDHAHSRGIIHRDIKPHNIMILRDGNVKVADFGIARLLTTKNTLTQETLGSVHYISPEQAKGGAVDARSDLYSLGVVMYEMLTSRLPFEGDSPVSIAIQHISAIPLMPREINPDIPIGLEDITMHAMDPNINTRYSSAAEMLEDLEEFRKNPSVRFNYSIVPSIADDDMDSTRTMPSREVTATLRQQNGNKISRDRHTPDEYRENRKKARSTSVMVGVFCVLVFLVALVAFMWNYALKGWISPDEQPTLEVDRFTGKLYEEVIADSYNNAYYTFTVSGTVESDTYPEGYIMDQYPEPGSTVTVGEDKIEIGLTVSSGPEPVLMIDADNMDYRDARTKLQQLDMGLVINVYAKPSEEYVEGRVFEQYPAKDEMLVSGMTIELYYSSGPESHPVEVPNLIGKTESEAAALLEAAELVGKREEMYSSEYEAGYVCGQDIDADEEVEVKSEITYYVSLGIEEVTVPYVVGKSKDEAVAMLEGQKLTVVVEETNNSATAGQVFSQSISANTKVTPNTVITISVSLGLKQVTVPSLIGLTKEQAADRLSSYELNGKCEEKYDSEAETGKVYFQSIEPSQDVSVGTTITYYVSLGPDPSTIQPEPEVTTEPSGGDETGETPIDETHEPPDTDEGEAVQPDG